MGAPDRHLVVDWQQEFARVRAHSIALIDGLSVEDCALQSMPDASPLKWHLAHTSWFWETFLLAPFDDDYQVFDPKFRYLFNSYYNGIGEQFPRPLRGLLSRPDLATVLAYRQHVDQAIERLITSQGQQSAERPAPWANVLELGLNHEQQHQELMLTDLKHLWSCSPLAPSLLAPSRAPVEAAPPAGWLRFGAGLVDIGHRGTGFGFDNESPRHPVFLAGFEIADRPVSNREFLSFVEAGAYDEPSYWLSEGFDHARAQAWQAPLYWRKGPNGWHEYTLHGEVPLDPDAPVCHVSYYEADAYARFAGVRLPTEFEWEHAAAHAPVRGQFASARSRHPVMPASEPGGALFGGVWTWTASSYSSYPGFRPAADAIGEYNGKFMVNQYVLRGGSCATPVGHVRASYRNFFPAATRWQFAGIRLARDC